MFYAAKPGTKTWLVAAIASVCLFGHSGNLANSAIGQQLPDDDSPGAALLRVTNDIKYLASDELGGRQPGTPEMAVCEKYIIDEYKRIGLKSPMEDGSYLQTFDVGNQRVIKLDDTSLALKGPQDEIQLVLNQDFKPQYSDGAVDLDSQLVFVGYGIRAADLNYDEYRDIDVKGKIAVMIRMEPQQNDADSVFDGTETSRFAFIQAKVAAAAEAGAVGMIMVNDSLRPEDDLAENNAFQDALNGMPFFHITREKFNAILAQKPVVRGNGDKLESLEKIEAAIDATLEPVSQPLDGWNAKMKTLTATEPIMTSNLIGVIEGEGPLADETIVIGGHYDHLGKGSYGSRVGYGEIHNGADDNATGTAGIMELARRFAKRDTKPARRLVFICFTAEEMGLLGAAHYCRNPVFPLEKTVTMLNYDMIGWLRDKKLTAYSWDSSPAFEGVLDRANQAMEPDRQLELVKPLGGFAGSDHLPFQQMGIPVMFLHTGLTRTYHTPEDDFETIDCSGAAHVIDYTEKLIDELVSLETRPEFSGAQRVGRTPTGPRLGVLMVDQEDGVLVETVTDDSLASKSGIQAGDIIVAIDGEAVTRRREITRKLQVSKGKTLALKIKRGEETIEVPVELPDE